MTKFDACVKWLTWIANLAPGEQSPAASDPLAASVTLGFLRETVEYKNSIITLTSLVAARERDLVSAYNVINRLIYVLDGNTLESGWAGREIAELKSHPAVVSARKVVS